MTSLPKGTDLEKEKEEGADLTKAPEPSEPTKVHNHITNGLLFGDPEDSMVKFFMSLPPSTKGPRWLADYNDVELGIVKEKPKETSLKECDSSDSEDGGEPKPDGGEMLGGEGQGTKRKREMSEGQFMSKKIFSPLMKAYAMAVEMRPDDPSEWILYCVEKEMKGVKDGNKV